MPGALIERPKMTRCMYQALKRHIMREREKKKQEQEQDEAMERLKKERELRKKKEEEDSLTLEQNKEQIAELERKLETLRQEKRELFSQLKKVLHQEDNTKKKAQMREQSEMMSLQQQYAPGMVSGHAAMFLQGGMMRPSSKYLNHIQPAMVQAGMKRARSPSPPPQQPIYSGYNHNASSNAKYPPTTYGSGGKPENYQQQKPPTSYPTSTHVTYVSQSGHTYQQPPQQASYPSSQSGAGSKYPANQSAFTSYPHHYAHQQKQITEHYPQGYAPVQRLPQPQPGYLNSPHTGSSIPLQQQLEHANQKSGFSEEKFKLQQHQQQLRGLAPQQVMNLPQHPGAPPPPVSSASQPKGSIMTGYPVRTQAGSQSTHSSPPGAPRHNYTRQQPGSYY